MRYILGVSAYYHDSAAALLQEGRIVAAAQEERFSRRKNDERFPTRAVEFCLRQGAITAADLEAVVFYDKPLAKFARMLETFLAVAPRGGLTFQRVLPSWLSEKLNLRKTLKEALPGLSPQCSILFTEHHQAHAASAFYPSPFPEAAILTVDGVGEWATTTIAVGKGNRIELVKEIRFPHSLGLLYSAFTAYCGFRVNSGEYKLMGLAPYGEARYRRAIYDHLIDVKPDGSFWLNLQYFDFLHRLRMTNERFDQLFDGPPRRPSGPIEPRHMDVARSIQVVTEELLLKLARHARAVTGLANLCLAGGVALNCVANGRILREKIFDQIWIQPAAGDAGGALGAALEAWNQAAAQGGGAPAQKNGDAMHGACLGPEFNVEEIEAALRARGAVYQRLDPVSLLERTVDLLSQEKVIGWFQGRMEFGPRALGNRSILGDARSPRMQSVINLKIKFRESFRPFAPVVRREVADRYFDLEVDSPYMLLVAPVRTSLRLPLPDGARGLDLLRHERSRIPAVTHVDYSSRVQTLSEPVNPLLYRLLAKFETATGCGLVVNTSFNVREEPIVCSPEDAYRCFMHTGMDFLVVGPFLLDKNDQSRRSAALTEVKEGADSDGDWRMRMKDNPKEWRKFALVWTVALALLIYGLLYRHRIPWPVAGAGWGLLALGCGIACLAPRWVRPIYRRVMSASHFVGQGMGRLLLTVVFFLAVAPLGILLRLAGKDPLDLKRKPNCLTYWHPVKRQSRLDRSF